MREIWVVYGKSSVGKDTFADSLVNRGAKKITRYTTRPKRETEVDGREYHFIPSSSWAQMEFLEWNRFNEDWLYGTAMDDLLYDVPNVIIGSIETYLNIKNVAMISPMLEDVKVIGIKIGLDDKERILRSLQRETDPSIEYICKRYLSELEQYEGLEDVYDILLDSNNPPHIMIQDCFRQMDRLKAKQEARGEG